MNDNTDVDAHPHRPEVFVTGGLVELLEALAGFGRIQLQIKGVGFTAFCGEVVGEGIDGDKGHQVTSVSTFNLPMKR